MRWALLVVLVLDAVMLALLELFFLPLRLPSQLGGWMLPLTIVLAGVTTPLLVSAAARLVPGRVSVAGAPLAAWLLTIIALGVAGPGGDTVLPIDVRSLALLAAAVVPSGVVLGRIGSAALTELTAPPAAGPVDGPAAGYPAAAGRHDPPSADQRDAPPTRTPG